MQQVFYPQTISDYYHQTGRERVGFILKDGQVVEVPNCSPSPDNSFDVDADYLIQYEDKIAACFHTHPGAPSTLSSQDFYGFSANPEWVHYIVGCDGISAYATDDHGRLVKCAAGPLSCTEPCENTANS